MARRRKDNMTEDDMNEADERVRGIEAKLIERICADMPAFTTISRRIQLATQQNERTLERLSMADCDWILRLAHYGMTQIHGKLLERNV